MAGGDARASKIELPAHETRGYFKPSMRLCLLILVGTAASAFSQTDDRQAAYRQLRDEARAASLIEKVSKDIDNEHYEAALAKAEEALKLNPNDPVTLNAHGAALTELGRYEEAAHSLDAAIAANPDAFPPLYNLSETLVLQKKYRDAAEQFRALQRRFGAMPILKYKLYFCYALDGQQDKAAAALKSLIHPMDGPAWYYGHALENLIAGNKAEARRLQAVAEAIHPKEVKTYRETLRSAGLLK